MLLSRKINITAADVAQIGNKVAADRETQSARKRSQERSIFINRRLEDGLTYGEAVRAWDEKVKRESKKLEKSLENSPA